MSQRRRIAQDYCATWNLRTKRKRDSLSIEDPANPDGNDLSELLNSGVRYTLASVAASTLTLIENSGWESVFGTVEEDEEKTNKAKALRQAAAAVVTPSKPWASN